MSGKKVFVSEFLIERKDRFKPDEANNRGLHRLEKIDFSGKIYISENKSTKTNMILVKKGDLVISGINVEKGALSVYEGNSDILATIHYSSYEYDKNKINIEYLKWFLKSPNFQKLLLDQNGGGIKTEMKAKTFLKLEVFLPTLEKQENILKIIQGQEKEILELENISNKNLNYIKQLKQAILQEAIEGKLTKSWRENNPNIESAEVLLKKIQKEKEELIKQKKLKKQNDLKEISQEEIPFEIPENWSWCRLGEICQLITKGSSPTWQGVNYVDKGLLFITSENVGNYNLILNKLKYVEEKFNEIEPRSILRKGDILMNIVGGSIGRTAIYNLDNIANINQAVCLIRLINNLDKSFFLHFFNGNICINYMFNKQVVNARENLSMGSISNFLIPLPPLEEQKEIVKKVDEMMRLCNELEKQSLEVKGNSENLMKSVLSEVFIN